MTPKQLKFWNYLVGTPQHGNTFQGDPKSVGLEIGLSEQEIQELQDKYKAQYFKAFS